VILQNRFQHYEVDRPLVLLAGEPRLTFVAGFQDGVAKAVEQQGLRDQIGWIAFNQEDGLHCELLFHRETIRAGWDSLNKHLLPMNEHGYLHGGLPCCRKQRLAGKQILHPPHFSVKPNRRIALQTICIALNSAALLPIEPERGFETWRTPPGRRAWSSRSPRPWLGTAKPVPIFQQTYFQQLILSERFWNAAVSECPRARNSNLRPSGVRVNTNWTGPTGSIERSLYDLSIPAYGRDSALAQAGY
jgi:hypothetical protein